MVELKPRMSLYINEEKKQKECKLKTISFCQLLELPMFRQCNLLDARRSQERGGNFRVKTILLRRSITECFLTCDW